VPLGCPPPLTRRTALGGAVAGVVVLTGCGEHAPRGVPEVDPDGALVDRAAAELDELVALVAAAGATRPLRRVLAPFEALHRAHRAVLPAGSPSDAPPRVTGTADEDFRLVLRREEQARARFARWALAAESGPLARLLASMSAGIAAHVAAAPAGVPR